MGNAVIWYQPEGATRATRIDLGGKFQERAGPFVRYTGAYSESLGGASTKVIYGGRMDVTFRRTWQRTGSDGTDSGSVLWRSVYGLVAHLKRGGSCVVSEDETYTWAAFSSRTLPERADGIPFATPTLTDLLAPGVSPNGRELVVHSDPDLYLTEARLCDGVSAIGNRAALDEALVETYGDARWVLVREAGTYPAMRVPESQRGRPLLDTRDNRRWTLDLPLEEDPDQLERLAQTGAQLAGDDDSAMGQFPDLVDWEAPWETGKQGYRW